MTPAICHYNNGMDIEEQVLEAENNLISAILDKDLATLIDLFDEEYVFTGSRGETWGKEKALADFRDPCLSIQELSVSELEVTVHRDTAVVTGISHIKGYEGHNPLTGEYRFTRTWRLSDGDWRVVAVQTSRI